MQAEDKFLKIYSKEIYLKRLSELSESIDTAILGRAFDFSYAAHLNQFRKSGKPFFSHPLEVSLITAEQNMDTVSIAAALLHDVVEDTEHGLDEIRHEFGNEIGDLIYGLTKIDDISLCGFKARQAENYRRMLLSMAKDMRVLIIKFADRLHNLRTLGYMPPEKIRNIAAETLDIYAPLAHRFGMHRIKSELEDLAFKHLNPEMHLKIVSQLNYEWEEREKIIAGFTDPLSEKLREAGIGASVTGRSKHLYGIYQKMVSKNKDFYDIHDHLGVRVIVDNYLNCYMAMGIVHNMWFPVTARFKDYIATPKINMYQSIHTTVIGPEGRMFEVQIRTGEMDRIAERGIAAHWIYKQGNSSRSLDEQEMSWLRKVVEWQKGLNNPSEFMEFFRTDLFQSEIFVFTPKGDLIQLPKGSTVLDFAFEVHTGLGHQCIGARINETKVTGPDFVLQSGSTVEVIKSNSARHTASSLGIVRTTKAKTAVKHWLKNEGEKRIIEIGRKIFSEVSANYGIETPENLDFSPALSEFNYQSKEELFHAVGNGGIPSVKIIKILFPEKRITEGGKTNILSKIFSKKKEDSSYVIFIEDGRPGKFKLARCCMPVPGDEIIAFRGETRTIVHRKNCRLALRYISEGAYMENAGWSRSIKQKFRTKIKIVSENKIFMLSRVARAISKCQVSILNANVNVNKGGESADYEFLLHVDYLAQLFNVIEKVRRIRGVKKVRRI
ncbi:MAG: RelA/SpoT family protein [Fibrobacterota bacterium]